MGKHFVTLFLAGLIPTALIAPSARGDEPPAKKIRVLLIDGQNNHDWRSTSPWLKKILEETGRFTVDVSSNLKPGDRPGNIKNTVPFPPDLTGVSPRYDVVLNNYNGASWPKEFQT